MNDMNILSNEQIFGSEKLDIFKKYGTTAAITDFAILLGGGVSNEFYASSGKGLIDRTGYWVSSTSKYGNALGVDCGGDSHIDYVDVRDRGIRPTLLSYQSGDPKLQGLRNEFGILEVQYGEYPSRVVFGLLQGMLEKEYNHLRLKQTGRTYITDSRKFNEYGKDFKSQAHVEYEYENKIYVRVKANFSLSEQTLSDGMSYKNGGYVWVEVEPITWLVDEKTGIMVSKKCICSGVRFDKVRGEYRGKFNKTELKMFIDGFLSNEIIMRESKAKTDVIYENDFSKVLPATNVGTKISDIATFGQNFQMGFRALTDSISTSIRDSSAADTAVIMNSISNVMKEDKNKVFKFIGISLQKPPKKTKLEEIEDMIKSLDDNQNRLLSEMKGYEYFIDILENIYIPGLDKMISEVDNVLETEKENTNQRIETLKRKKEEFILNKVTVNQTIMMMRLTHENGRKQYLKASTISTNLVPLLKVQMAINIGNKTQKESIDLERALKGAIIGLVEENRQMILENTNIIEEYQPDFGIYNKMSETIDDLKGKLIDGKEKQKILLPPQ